MRQRGRSLRLLAMLLGLPWLAAGLNLRVTVAALAWSFAMILAPHRIDPPLIMFSALPLAFVVPERTPPVLRDNPLGRLPLIIDQG